MSDIARSRWSVLVLAAAFFIGGVFFAAGANVFNTSNPFAVHSQAEPVSVAPVTVESTEDLGEAFANVAEAVNPAVVQILSTRMVRQPGMDDFFRGTPFEQFFGTPDRDGQGREIPRQGLGSGVIIRPDGYIVTNNHVIDQVDEIEVRLYDGRRYTAEVVGTDPNSDLAVIRIDENGLSTLGYSNINDVRVGQWVLAVGSPLSEDLGNSVTAGIVSAIGRVSTRLAQLNLFSTFLQTDAAINPGNSGGALVNLRGEIVGINTAIATRTGGYQGVGFAIPVDVVQNVSEQLIETGMVRRGYLGLSFGSVSESLARTLEVRRGSAQVTSIVDDGPADQAGLQEGDVIVSVGGVELRDANELRTIVGNMLPGQEVELDIVRNGDRQTLAVELGERPTDEELAERQPGAPGSLEPGAIEGLGLELRNLTPALAQRFNIEDSAQGILVVDVEQASQAWRDAEIRPGMRIVEVDRQPVSTVSEFISLYEQIESGSSFLVRIQNPNDSTFLTALTKP